MLPPFRNVTVAVCDRGEEVPTPGSLSLSMAVCEACKTASDDVAKMRIEVCDQLANCDAGLN